MNMKSDGMKALPSPFEQSYCQSIHYEPTPSSSSTIPRKRGRPSKYENDQERQTAKPENNLQRRAPRTSSITPLPTPPTNNPLHTLSDSKKLRLHNFGVLLKNRTKVYHCPSCKERWPNMAIRLETGMFRRCHGKYKSNVVPKFSAANNMDPVPVTAELDGLTYVVSMLIARVHPIIGCHILKGGRFESF
ncbi:hypothetical protein PsorP6_008138 [Peronosclerospora sorghi]|uniref:Uncharacterized protein n=1 Tax=Peronosclerospora sorghi TaxID=230839 RepID=A0ACC0W6Z0_9STRA|nr:hypothetical protein PsorP6_008138 [Peronosclerospora sorghi]